MNTINTSNYEKTKYRVMSEFKQYDHAAIADKLGLKLDKKYIYTDFFGSDYRIDRESGLVELISRDNAGSFSEADFFVVMTIYDILCYSKPGATPSGEYTLIHQLSTVQNAHSYAGEGAFDKDAAFFDNAPELLRQRCEALGGEPFGKGDISYRLRAFKDLYVLISFWGSDEDFPPQLQIMCDTKTLDYMHYETIWYMAHHIVDLLRQPDQDLQG